MSDQRHTALPFRYRVMRSRRRKTAALQIRDDEVLVRVPAWVRDDWIEGFVSSREAWILSHLQRSRTACNEHRIEITQGAMLPYCGIELCLGWQQGGRTGIERQGDRLLVTLSRRIRRPAEEAVSALVQQWLQQQAEAVLGDRVRTLAGLTGLQPSSIAVRGFRRRWGHCDSRGGIVLNWRLVMADTAAADYVLVHELCHLRHFDHSARFWALVERHCPEYRRWQDYFRRRQCWLQW